MKLEAPLCQSLITNHMNAQIPPSTATTSSARPRRSWFALLLAFGVCGGLAPNVSATLLLDEPFSYADPSGPLEAKAPGLWFYYSGTSNQIVVSENTARLSNGAAEEVGTVLPGWPYTNGNLYVGFKVACPLLPTGSNAVYFAEFIDATNGTYNARIFITTNGAAAAHYRLGIANTASTTTNYLEQDLALQSTNRLVLRCDVASGTNTLWLNPFSETQEYYEAPSMVATDPPHPAAPIKSFALRQTAAPGPNQGIVYVDDLKIATSFPEAAGVWDNRLAATNNSYWENAANWSLGTPSTVQAGSLIANSPSKTVTIDSFTATYYPGSLLISNLTLTATNSSTTNTLLLNNTGTNHPLLVSNILTLGSAGALILSNSALSLPGSVFHPSWSLYPGFYVDGRISLCNTSLITATSGSLIAGNFPGSSNGLITINSGSTLLAHKLMLGYADHAFGSLTLNSGTVAFPGGTNMLAIGVATNASGAVTVNGGLLQVLGGTCVVGGERTIYGPSQMSHARGGSGTLTVNGGEAQLDTAFVGSAKPGSLLVQGGTVVINQALQIGLESTGTVSVASGQLLATNGDATITVGNSSIGYGHGYGTLIIGSNGVVVATHLLLATNDGSAMGGEGTVIMQPGGSLTCGNNLLIGVSTGSTGSVNVTGGTITVPEIVLGQTNCTGVLNLTNGSVTTSNLVLGPSVSSTGVVNVASGTLTATNGLVQIGPVGSGQLNISGGNTIVRSLKLGGPTNGASGTLHLTGGHLTVLSNLSANFIIVGCGDLDGSGGTVIIGEDHDGSMEITCGAATNITTLLVGYTPGYSGTFTQDGGLMTVQGNAIVGQVMGVGALGTMTLGGGYCYVTNAAHTALLDVRNGTVGLNNGAALTVDTLIVTNANGHFLKGGGLLTVRSKVLSASLDADGDGLPNGWEQAHGLDPLSALDDDGALGDPDHDGQGNLAEYRAGTDPQNPDSVFRMLSAKITGQNVRFDWTVVGGHSYVVQIATNSTGGITNRFADLSGLISVGGMGEGATNYVHAGGATKRGAYYRIRLGP
jgi:hypothetical protein